MLREKIHRKICAMAMLTAFCTLIFISQTTNLKISNSKIFKTSIAKSAAGACSSGKEGQATPVNNAEEEEDDEFKVETDFLAPAQAEFFAIKYLPHQESPNNDPHLRVISPPPQI